MATWTRKESHISDPPILAFADNVSTPYSITLLDDKVNLDASGKRTFPAGMIICKIGSEYRLLPRGTTAAAITASSTTSFTVSPYQGFYAGDVLSSILPFTTVTAAGTYANTETATVTIDGRATVSTFTGTPTLTQVAAQIATDINNNDAVNQLVTAVASAAIVYIFGSNGTTLRTVTASETATAGTLTAGAAALVANAPVGTVQSVVQTTGNTGTITLTAVAGTTLPIGTAVGVLVDELYGIYPTSQDLTDLAEVCIAPIEEGKIWRGSLPHWDGDLARRLPNLLVRSKF